MKLLKQAGRIHDDVVLVLVWMEPTPSVSPTFLALKRSAVQEGGPIRAALRS